MRIFVLCLQAAPSTLERVFSTLSEPGGWRTWLVALAIYGAYIALTLAHTVLPVWLLAVLGGLVIAWHGSLQHETIHGHPFTSRRCNTALGYPPLSLCLPYRVYRATHLRHHRSALCDPTSDPESNYVDPRTWTRAGVLQRWLWSTQRTLAGRMLLGPWLLAVAGLRQALRSVTTGTERWVWLEHAVAVSLVLLYVTRVAGMPIETYLLCFAYPGLAWTSMRSLAEHRPATTRAQRSAIVEAHPLWSMLFLYNNLHAVHHRNPRLPWYRLAAHYRRHRDAVLRGNGDYVIAGYGSLLRHHAWHPIDAPVVRLDSPPR